MNSDEQRRTETNRDEQRQVETDRDKLRWVKRRIDTQRQRPRYRKRNGRMLLIKRRKNDGKCKNSRKRKREILKDRESEKNVAPFCEHLSKLTAIGIRS
jgi:hypothetical protein